MTGPAVDEGVRPRGLATGQPGCVRLGARLVLHRDHAAAFASPVQVSRTPVRAALRSCGSGRLLPPGATGTGSESGPSPRPWPAGRNMSTPLPYPAPGRRRRRRTARPQARPKDRPIRSGRPSPPERSERPPTRKDSPYTRCQRVICRVCHFRGPSHSVHGPGSVIIATPRNEALTCNVSEPPIGIEPMTYALREARSRAVHPLAAPIAQIIAPTTLATLGLSKDPFHEPFHDRGPCRAVLNVTKHSHQDSSTLWMRAHSLMPTADLPIAARHANSGR